ncbi:DNA repair protein MucB [Granulimonas faecalis]|uniref:DNA repair protein MucB n=1 Tax=Granulimonas faecalis TaxID=2894155 RepID=A0AAV5B8C0_9ACTN|nr:helix-hairpin-helix domain-containing protein [Granulimonas faecalis]GJM56216.1 DNA repair protein MucB [Granulimonas faecalis]
MGEAARVCLCIDLRSFYATVEAVDRGLDPMEARLVVADPDRSANTICLAVSPRLKAEGVRNRCRMREVPKDRGIVVARPRMARYLEASCEVVACLLEHVSADDVHVYSVDESFIEIGPYLPYYGLTPRAMAKRLQEAVAERLGYPATCGLGPNLFVAKVALDVLAKHDTEGICELDLPAFYRDIWFHRPITDIWQVGPGTARRLASAGIVDLAGVAAADPKEISRLLGPARARLLVDHAWGLEPATVSEVSAWEPKGKSLTRGQVLMRDYTTAEAATVVREMADELALSAEADGWDAQGVSLYVGYSGDTWPATGGSRPLEGRLTAHGVAEAAVAVFAATAYPGVPIRRVNVTLTGLTREGQPRLFDPASADPRRQRLDEARRAVAARFGKASVLLASSLLPEGTARDLAGRIGGHRA